MIKDAFCPSVGCVSPDTCLGLGECQAAMVINSEMAAGHPPGSFITHLTQPHCDHPEVAAAIKLAEVYLAQHGDHYYLRALQSIVEQLDSKLA